MAAMVASCSGRIWMWVPVSRSLLISRAWRRASMHPHSNRFYSQMSVKVFACAHTPKSEQGGRRLWLPGLDAPAHLDGSLPGDFGFDPLELGKEPESLRWYVQAELIHARFAMAGVAGILFTDLIRTLGLKDLPVWYEAGATQFDFADTRTLFIVQLLLMGFVESKRYMDIKVPHSQATKGSFLCLEPALRGLEPGYQEMRAPSYTKTKHMCELGVSQGTKSNCILEGHFSTLWAWPLASEIQRS